MNLGDIKPHKEQKKKEFYKPILSLVTISGLVVQCRKERFFVYFFFFEFILKKNQQIPSYLHSFLKDPFKHIIYKL